MEKIIIHLIVPAIEKEFDVYIPRHMTIRELTKLFVKAIDEVTEHNYISSGEEILCLKERNTLLHQEITVNQYGIQNGDHIFMI